MSTPSSSYNGTPISMAPTTAVMATPTTLIKITPISAISPISPVNARFRLPMTHGQDTFGEGTGAEARVVVPESKERRTMEGWRVEGSWGQGGSGILGIEAEEDARTEIWSPKMAMGEGDVYGVHSMSDLRLPPARSFLPSAPVYPPSGAAVQQIHRAMRVGAASQDVLLYGPAGVTPAPAELARHSACDKLPPIPNVIPSPSHVPQHPKHPGRRRMRPIRDSRRARHAPYFFAPRVPSRWYCTTHCGLPGSAAWWTRP
ncbi:hypothetical protein BDV93DRAFT_165840 [Ceratobasidium sp. AG-I]|nr:hypothetical protein BDV93DRAFT_165840 [Ceratobasidium sp. AG-I]